MKVNFYLSPRTNKAGETVINVSVLLNGARILLSTYCKTEPDLWDEKSQRMNEETTDLLNLVKAEQINEKLNKIKNEIRRAEAIAMLSEKKITLDEIKAAIARAVGEKEVRSHVPNVKEAFELFFAWGAEYKGWKVSTLLSYRPLKNIVLAWKKNPTWSDFTAKGLQEFVNDRRRKSVADSTLAKQMSRLKTFLSWCDKKGWLKDRSYLEYELKTAPNKDEDVVFLEWDELMRLWKCEVPATGTSLRLVDALGKENVMIIEDAARMERTRDVFCFCAFTSLRYSDAQGLRWENVKRTQSGVCLVLTSIKTRGRVKIELNKYAIEVLEKYKDVDNGGYVLPRLTNQRMNLLLKDLGRLCGFNTLIARTHYSGNRRIDEVKPKWQYLCTHTARRTFICNALELGIPVNVVMKWTGHSTYNAMRPYIDVADKAKEREMDKFNSLMN